MSQLVWHYEKWRSLQDSFCKEFHKSEQVSFVDKLKMEVKNFGTEMEARYLLTSSYIVFANATYQTLCKADEHDGLEDGFNTPSWIINTGLTGEKLYKGFGFSIPRSITVNRSGSRFL